MPGRIRRLRKLLYASLLVFFLLSCRDSRKEPEPLALSGSWYGILEGKFEKVDRVRTLATTALLPWTVQARVAAIASRKDKIYLAVNGHGIAAVKISNPGEPEFHYYYDPLIFKYRTMTTLIPYEDFLLCHLYFNKLLNTVGEESLKIQGISLIRLFPEDDIYQFVSLPFQEEHPDWESVGFLPENPDRFYLEWKYTDREETLFQYSRFSSPEMAEEPTDKLAFRRAYNFRDINGENIPPGLKSLFQTAIRSLSSKKLEPSFHFLIRTEDDPLVSRYEYHPAGFTQSNDIRLYTLRIVRQRDSFYLLLPRGLILKSGQESGLIESYELPPLPEGFRYTDLFITGNTMLAAWEQSRFTQVGAAGFYLASNPSPG